METLLGQFQMNGNIRVGTLLMLTTAYWHISSSNWRSVCLTTGRQFPPDLVLDVIRLKVTESKSSSHSQVVASEVPYFEFIEYPISF